MTLKTFVAFDFETTGLNASKDRIIEIGCVKFDSRFTELERFETLINPKRDVGRTDIHGITPSHLRNAPEFGDIVQEFCEFINGSTLIAHNKSFDLRFLQSELARYGLAIAELDGLCTMELIQSAYPNSPRRLGQCCEFLGIAVENTHQALSDAYMSAQIAIHVLKNFGYPAIPNAIDFVRSEFPAQRKSVLVRSDTETDSEKTSGFIEKLITQLPSSTSLGGRFTIASAEYLNLLDQVLEDRLIETQEAEELKDLALSFGLSLENVQILHSSYLFNLCNLALADGEVTANEEADIALVSSLLGIAEWRKFLKTKISSSVAPQTDPSMIPDAATVCFTGTMSQSREVLEDLARENGLQVLPGVTKKLDFLVVADPYTESSKARQARKYGTSIMSEKAFRELVKTGTN